MSFRGVLLLLASALIAACGGSGGGGAAGSAFGGGPVGVACDPADAGTADQCGTVLVSVTDADGDFVTYTVDVRSIALRRATGPAVETLPAATRIDFASLVDVSELLSAALLPPGVYVGGSITLDYSNADIHVEAGGEIVPASVVDADGMPLGVVTLDFRLAPSEPLLVTRASLNAMTIDFDLAASHAVDVSVTPATAVARPYLSGEVTPVEDKPLRVRGALRGVDVAASSYSVRVRPWHQRIGEHGTVTVHTTGETRFDIDGAVLTGAAGLQALAALETGTLTTAHGTFAPATRRFTAERVHAGSSVGGQTLATIYGNVTARSGDRLFVRGALGIAPDHPQRFHRRVIVAVGPDTRVYKLSRPLELLDTNAISIGQRIVAFGALSLPSDSDAAGAAPVLDATDSRVRLDPTRLRGTVTAVQPGQINMQLRGIDRLGAGLFDFSGTGINGMLDADPDDYEIATGTLSLSDVDFDRPAHVIGFVMPFGAAPPDFEARTLIGHRVLPAVLGVGWGPSGTSAPFTMMEPGGLTPNLLTPDLGLRHHLLIGARQVDLKDLPAAPSIAPHDGRALFGISQRGRIDVYRDFAAFVDALSGLLGQGDKVLSVAAYGHYDEMFNRLNSARVSVHVIPTP